MCFANNGMNAKASRHAVWRKRMSFVRRLIVGPPLSVVRLRPCGLKRTSLTAKRGGRRCSRGSHPIVPSLRVHPDTR
jgi:hypothetical protein